jgi:hypothetical protein
MAKKLQLHYYPLEISTDIDEVTRVRYMEEWVSKAHTLLLGLSMYLSIYVSNYLCI